MSLVLLLVMTSGHVDPREHAVLKVNSSYAETVAIGKPKQKATWSMPPTVRVCETTGVSFYRVSKAIRFWEMLGYKFDGVFTDRDPSCMNPRYGEILITLPESGFSSEHMASTRLYTHTRTGEVVKAKIHILPNHARKSRVLEHEFGHALGWSHYSQRHHIMHPEWENGGTSTQGLRKK